jgi:hypothetical protein
MIPDNTAAGRPGQPHRVHLPYFGVDEVSRRTIRGEHGRQLRAQPFQERARGSQRHQDRQQVTSLTSRAT